MALEAIDREKPKLQQEVCVGENTKIPSEPIYENFIEAAAETNNVSNGLITSLSFSTRITSRMQDKAHDTKITDEEPYYQVPKSAEPYYEVPKYPKPVPVYENVEIFAQTDHSGISYIPLEPPKEKPPPPPIEDIDIVENETDTNTLNRIHRPKSLDEEQQPLRRENSTKRIKNELRNKRSSFLGIQGSIEDENFLQLTVAPPPDMAQLLQEERRLERQLYIKAGLYESSDAGESRDSGVSENHSRQSSEPFTNSSDEPEDRKDLLSKNEKEIIDVLAKEEVKQRHPNGWSPNEDEVKIRCIEDQIREQEEVLRVERELLLLEQEELKRQRETLMMRENLARRELQHGAKMFMSANRYSLQDINASADHYANVPKQIYQIDTDYRKSMSDLNEVGRQKLQPIPPAKPLRTLLSIDTRHVESTQLPHQNVLRNSQSIEEFAPLRNHNLSSSRIHGHMTRNTLHALSAVPKLKFTDRWVGSDVSRSSDNCLSYQQKRKSVPEGYNYNRHWLIQEAEQRRIDQQLGVRGSKKSNSGDLYCAIERNGRAEDKPLPDAVIQTLTQRVQSKGIGERRRLEAMHSKELTIKSQSLVPKTLQSLSSSSSNMSDGSQERILSVSGKKKCSHCGEELGRGAAMIIESLRLFYHIDCFKCCVCHVQLGDGLNGTDVRVRNQKLHCHNCYSSDDGVKFSCV